MITPELKRKWLKALRSGEYQQCYHSYSLNRKYCVMGVFREIGGDVYAFPEDSFNLLTGYNDNERWTFRQLADWIETNIEVIKT